MMLEKSPSNHKSISGSGSGTKADQNSGSASERFVKLNDTAGNIAGPAMDASNRSATFVNEFPSQDSTVTLEATWSRWPSVREVASAAVTDPMPRVITTRQIPQQSKFRQRAAIIDPVCRDKWSKQVALRLGRRRATGPPSM